MNIAGNAIWSVQLYIKISSHGNITVAIATNQLKTSSQINDDLQYQNTVNEHLHKSTGNYQLSQWHSD